MAMYANRYSGGAFGVGSITQYIGSVTALSNAVSLLFSTIGNLRNNTAFLRIVFEFLDIPGSMHSGSLTIERKENLNYEIEFRNVSFKYPGQENYALRNISLTFQVGHKLAIVGTNGSGKTTFIKLLCRLYDQTAALDPIAEFEVYNRMNEIIGDKTAVFISHRLSSCRFCQDIAVFHQGYLVQRGSHDELVNEKEGKYFELWNAQARYYTNALCENS